MYKNQSLFSRLYLDELIRSEAGVEDAKKLITRLSGWHSGWDDSSLESILSTIVEPTLVSLDFSYQRSSKNEEIVELTSSSDKEDSLGLCYVVSLDEDDNLDSTVKGRHYAADLIHTLKEEKLMWGLLTDGKYWRLYNAEELAPYETYLEVDLKAVVEGGDSSQDAGILFHELFRKEAFLEDDKGECELDCQKKLSEEATEFIEEHLSDCIEEVMRDLCQGFVEQDDRKLYTESRRDEIFSDATILLYRMLFMLYAEARGLLPIGDPAYDPVSLSSLVDQAIDYTKESGLEYPDGTTLWQGMSDLSSWINSGDEEHHIPCYNGDLFDDEDKPYIHDFTIPDKYLAPALFSLGTIEADNEERYRRIDYRDLSVQHLGSIYEGLLEYKLFIAQEKRVRRPDGKGGYSFPELAETTLKKGEEDNIIDVHEVYFAHNAGERKATGAYYTPEYIVDYIVENTVRRGLEERREMLEEMLPQWISEAEAPPPGERPRLQRTVDQRLLEFVEEEVLAFNVCDPAMGSGHFLVNASHQMTSFIVETLNLTKWKNTEVSSDPVYWRRRVVKSCIYGVDLNELAVELAKLSLWLTAIERGKPLGFLDHHLRPGNSLIGARMKDLTELLYEPTTKEKKIKEAGQLTMYDAAPEFSQMFTELQEKLDRISSMVAENPEEVKAQEDVYQEIREELKLFREMADAIVAKHFGVEVDNAEIQKILHKDSDRRLDQVASVSDDHYFFHWEFEFFDVFYTDTQTKDSLNKGFDVIVGNPPYDVKTRTENDNREIDYYNESFNSVEYKVNVFGLFIELAIQNVSQDALIGLIIPNTILANKYFENLRRQLLNETDLQQVVFFKDMPFRDATVETIILITGKNSWKNNETEIVQSNMKKFNLLHRLSKEVFAGFDRAEFRIFWKPKELSVWKKLHESSDNLIDSYDIYNGIKTSNNEEMLDSQSHGLPEWKPVIRGSDVTPYHIEWQSQYVLFDKSKLKSGFDETKHLSENKLVVRRADNRIIAALDDNKFYALDTLHILTKTNGINEKSLLGILNSTLATWWIRLMQRESGSVLPEIKIDFLSKFPLRKFIIDEVEEHFNYLRNEAINDFLKNLKHKTVTEIPDVSDYQISENIDENTNLCDLLSEFVDRMMEFIKKRYTLTKDLEHFNFFDKGVDFTKFTKVFPSVVKYEEQDLGLDAVNHDIEEIKLTSLPDGETWELQLKLKLRDPEQSWKGWQYEKGGNYIKREWVPAYHLKIDEEAKARYYQHSLPVRDEFANAGSLPGGYTRSTHKKLELSEIPAYDPEVDLTPLVELTGELEEVKRHIQLTDELIDQIVYKLYGLSEEEIAIIEGTD